MLSLKNISRSYLQRGQVLNNLSLEAEKGDTISITGPSGSGKTTLLNIIGLLDRPDSGEIFFWGSAIGNLSQEEAAIYRHKNVGFVFQDHLLLPYLNLLENIELPLLASNLNESEKGESATYISSLMERCGIAGLRDKLPHQVSGGEAQRATLVRALVNKPYLLLADEPTGSLDKDNADILAGLMLEMNQDYNTTIILVTHSDLLASRMKRMFEIRDGSLVPTQR